MKKILTFIFVFIVVSGGIKAQCNYEEIIVDLHSNDPFERYWATREISSCELVEAIADLEELFPIESELTVRVGILECLSILGSDYIEEFAYEIINSTQTQNFSLDINPAYAKVRATRVLFEIGMFSTYQKVYDFLENDFSEVNAIVCFSLNDIINNLPSEANNCKQWLINIVNNSTSELNKSIALEILFDQFGNEMVTLGLTIYSSEESMMVRFQVLKSLIKVNYIDLKDFLISNFQLDDDPSIRYRMCENLLNLFGEPSDLKAVIDYQPTEPDETTRSLMSFSIQEFIPPRPTVSTSEMIDNLQSYTQELLQYGWITEYSVYNLYQNKLSDIEEAYNKQKVNALCILLDDFLSYTEGLSRILLTIEGYKFMHYHGTYIKENVESEFGMCP